MDREQEASECRPADHRELERDGALRERLHEDLLRDERGRQRPARRRPERGRDAGGEREREEGPRLVRAGARDEQQADRDGGVEPDREREDRPAGVPVGEVPRRQRQERQRQEHREPDDPEVERVAVDRVDLPADRDERHLDRERRRHGRADVEREVPMPKRRGHEVGC